MPRTPQILIVSSEARTRAEVQAALQGIPDTAAVIHTATDLRQAVETVRNRRPDLALVEMSKDLRVLKAFAQEVAAASPETTLAAVFSPDVFGSDVSESAILIEAIRAGLQDFLRRPVSRPDLEQLLERLHRKSAAPRTARFGKVVSFISNKGGVGKSTLAVNCACGLARNRPDRVLLIDASLQMGVCSVLLDQKPATSLTDAVRERDRLDETLLRQLAVPHESGVHLLAAPADALEAAEIDDEVMARVLTLARRSYDYVLVDTFPMLDQVIVSVLDLCDRVYLVIEGVVPTVLGAVKLLQLLDNLGFPRERQRLVLNRYTGRADNLKPDDVARRLGRTVDHVLPDNRKVAIAANVGRPYILSAGRFWGLGRALNQLVDEMETIAPLNRPPRKPSQENNGAVPRSEVPTRDA